MGKLAKSHETELKIKLLDLEKKYEDQLKLQQKESDAILKECQTISEYNIIQSEIEKNKIITELEEKSKYFTDLEEKYMELSQSNDVLTLNYKNLENNFAQATKELTDFRQKLAEELEKKEKAVEALLKEKSSYEISIKTYQKTIEVLKNRLISSDRDVVQLKEELSKCEEKILEYESKCLQLYSDLKQTQMANEELEMQFDSTIKLNRIEIDNLRDDLCQKLKLYKNEVEKYSKRMQPEEDINDEIVKLRKDVERLQNLNSQYEFEIRRGQNELDGYHLREMDWSIRTETFEDTVKQLEDELKRKQHELRNLRLEISQLRHINDLNHQVLEANCTSNEDEKNIYAKYIQISGRYDEILQKFEDLQKENLEKDKIIENLSADHKEYAVLQMKHAEQVEKVNELLRKLENLVSRIFIIFCRSTL